MTSEVEETKKALVVFMRHLADGIEDGSLSPKGFNQLGGIVGKSHGKMKVELPPGSHQFMLLYEKP